MSPQGQTRCRSDSDPVAHNAYFYRLRISKYPANARQTINFPALL